MRRERNKIYGLFLEDRSWSNDDDTLCQEALSFYRKLFGSMEDVDHSRVRINVVPPLS